MIDILSEYLKHTASAEHYALIERAYELFDAHDFDEVDFQYERIITLHEDRSTDSADTFDQINQYTRAALLEIVSSYSIVVDEELALEDLINVVQAIWNVNDSDQPQALLDIAQSDSDPSMKLALILEVVSAFNHEYFLFKILMVNQAYFDQLITHYATQVVEEDNQDYLDTARQCSLALKSYLNFLQVSDIRTSAAIRSGVRFGLEIENYTRMLSHIWPTLPDTNIAVELYGIFLISCERDGNVKDVLERSYGLVMESPEQIARVRKVVANIIAKYTPTSTNKE